MRERTKGRKWLLLFVHNLQQYLASLSHEYSVLAGKIQILLIILCKITSKYCKKKKKLFRYLIKPDYQNKKIVRHFVCVCDSQNKGILYTTGLLCTLIFCEFPLYWFCISVGTHQTLAL